MSDHIDIGNPTDQPVVHGAPPLPEQLVTLADGLDALPVDWELVERATVETDPFGPTWTVMRAGEMVTVAAGEINASDTEITYLLDRVEQLTAANDRQAAQLAEVGTLLQPFAALSRHLDQLRRVGTDTTQTVADIRPDLDNAAAYFRRHGITFGGFPG